MLATKIKDWFDQFKQYYFTYSKGFFHLPYKGTGPELLLETIDELPFVTVDKKRQSIYTNTPFLAGGIYYQQLEEGCWVIYSRMKYKTNVCYELLKNKKKPNTFYFLSLNAIEPKAVIYKELSDKRITFPKYSWSFSKPTEDSHIKYIDLNFKGAENRYITIHFNEEWFQKNLAKTNLFSESELNAFIRSEQRFLYSPFDKEEYVLAQIKTFEKMFGVGNEKHEAHDLLELKKHSLDLIFDFLKHCKTSELVANYHAIDDDGQEAVSRVEKYLTEQLNGKFPGVDFLAKKFRIPEKKLYAEFNQLFGKSVYKYFQEKQMYLAKELLSRNNISVKEIAANFGYENVSKFSAAFKKYHDILPSEV